MKGEKLRHRLEHMGRKRAKTVKEGSSVRWRLKQVGVVRGEVKGGGSSGRSSSRYSHGSERQGEGGE